jgi:hypothetical protein
MEKTWETFWASGRVTDYLSYRNVVTESKDTDNGRSSGKRERHGTVRKFDGNGFDSHACQ